MKTVILHGDDTEKSRARFAEIVHGVKQKGWQLTNLNDGSASIREKVAAASLFPEDTLYILEKVQAVSAKDGEWLKKFVDDAPGSLLVFYQGDMPKKYLAYFPKTSKLEHFQLPKTVFAFLDSLQPGNARNSLKLMATISSKESFEFIFFLVAKLFRDLYWIRQGAEGIGYPAWRIGKLKAQASHFPPEQLVKILLALSEADIRSKTSEATATEALELLIATDYQVSYTSRENA